MSFIVPETSDLGRLQRKLLLVFVSYHTSEVEVNRLQANLENLHSEIGFALVVNDYSPGQPVEKLAGLADYFLTNLDNPGYGCAVNRLVAHIGKIPLYIGVLNTDLSWKAGTFETMLIWLQQHNDVVLAVPKILDKVGTTQKLCKRNPTVLGLLSRRFLPSWLKPSWLKRYDQWYVMSDQNYDEVFEVPYLSGCCMLIKSEAFSRVCGFDSQYFLYLEDADITRSLRNYGRCVHLPVAEVIHCWGKGNYRNFNLMLVNISSAWYYFCKWGWAIW